MGPLPKVHLRTMVVQEARNKLSSAALAIQQEYDLTTCEYLIILNELVASELRFALRTERHPDEPDRPADQA